MKRFVVLMTLGGWLLGSMPAVQAQDWRYVNGPYSAPPQQDHPVLKKVLIGAGLVGVGFLVGRLTAPKPGPVYAPPQLPVRPQPGWGQSWHHGRDHHAHPGGPFVPGRR